MREYQSVFRPDMLKDQVIVITGGGSGIGRCCAHEVASLGAKPVLVGRKEEKLKKVAAELEADGFASSWHSCDIRNGEQVAKVVTHIVVEEKRIDALVNSAGGQFPSPLKDISDKGWDAVIRNNLYGTFFVSREVYNQWMCDHGGAVINVIAAYWFGMPKMGHTGAARAGVANFTQTASLEWAHSGVRLNAIAPGPVASSGLDTYPEAFKARMKKRYRDVPLKRFATESEISAAIVFLLCPAANYITGQIIGVDGGLPLEKSMWPVPDHRKSTAYEGFHLDGVPEFLREAYIGSDEDLADLKKQSEENPS
ncbi:MAG: SDR family oxidoreductase [Gammaproteobacteria bacterium]|nr:SDR family oxidoreductase [Gammaproteobacteria bacterium]